MIGIPILTRTCNIIDIISIIGIMEIIDIIGITSIIDIMYIISIAQTRLQTRH